jgi:LmbE family N-acetylglucosaminyl deacetylase
MKNINWLLFRMIRKYQPEIVLCNAVDDRHIDHGKGSKLVSDACFLSGLRKIETQLDGQNQEAWRPKVVYHYMQWKNLEPDFVVDITGYNEIKAIQFWLMVLSFMIQIQRTRNTYCN